jgi:hypothetical protein
MKTTITKKIMTILMSVMVYASVSAQLITDTAMKKNICDQYMKAPFIFEEKLDSSKYFTIKTGEYTYENFMSYLVEVKKVIKGNIQIGTIEIVQYADGYIYKGTDHWESAMSSEDRGSPPAYGLCFCFDTNGYRMASNFKNSNSKTLRFYDAGSVTNNEIKKDPRGGLGLYFSKLSDFYDYISANYGVKIDNK